MTIFLSIFIAFSVFFTAIISGILGMGGGIILMGLLVWVLPVHQAMSLHAIIQISANFSRLLIHRNHLYIETMKYYIFGISITFIIFCFIAFLPNKIIIFSIIGITPFLQFILKKKINLNFSKPIHALLSGILVTIFHLTSGTAGPILSIFFIKTELTRHQVIATKAFTQVISNILKFIYFSLIISKSDSTTIQILPIWLYLLVVLTSILGSYLSKYFLNKITDYHFYKITEILILIIGSIYIFKALLLIYN